MAFEKSVDLGYTDGEGYDEHGPSLLSRPSHPGYLCFTLTERELKMLDLDPPDEPGEIIHINVMASVKSINKVGENCRLEMQVERILMLENESKEGEESEEGEDDEDEEGDWGVGQ